MRPTLVNAEQAAEEVSVSRATIRKWVERGHLTACGRIDGADLFDLAQVRLAERGRHRSRRRHAA